ncbi:MAG: tetratricopeptide repeat protein, partial [Candidatus Brocadiae bacterium]|nr:tetratricopeptide repeat protein [Candidatus Brocadiia bacterium]
DATWPSQAGTSMLYTLEHFQNGRRRLKPGGIMTSWLPFDMPLEDLKTALRTFHEVFPHVYIWSVLSRMNKHSLIIGSDRPLRVDAARFMDRFERFARQDLEVVYLDDPAIFLSCHLTKLEGDVADLADAPLHTQNLPRLQFLYSRPEEYRRYREPKQVSAALRFFAAHRDSIRNYLHNAASPNDPNGLLARVQRADEANDHFLKAQVRLWENPGESEMELRLAARLAPNHPAVRAEAPSRLALRDLTPEQIRRLDLTSLKEMAGQLFLQGQYQKALVALQEWAGREPGSAVPRGEIGLLYINVQRPDLAIPHLRRAAELDPQSADVRFNLGVAHLGMRQPDSALTHLERALQLEPESADTMERLGVAHAMKGDKEEALAFFERAVALDPGSAAARHSLAVFLAGEGRLAQAVPHLEKLVELRPNSLQAHSMLADACRTTGDEEAAQRHLSRAAELRAAQ